MSIGENIKRLRKERGLSQLELATKIGISRSYLSELEHDKRDLGTRTLSNLAQALKTSIPYLQGLTDISVPDSFIPEILPADIRELAEKLAAVNVFIKPEGYSIDLGAIGEGTVALRGPRGWHELSQDEISELLNTTVGGIDAWLNSMDDSRALSPEKDGDD